MKALTTLFSTTVLLTSIFGASSALALNSGECKLYGWVKKNGKIDTSKSSATYIGKVALTNRTRTFWTPSTVEGLRFVGDNHFVLPPSEEDLGNVIQSFRDGDIRKTADLLTDKFEVECPGIGNRIGLTYVAEESKPLVPGGVGTIMRGGFDFAVFKINSQAGKNALANSVNFSFDEQFDSNKDSINQFVYVGTDPSNPTKVNKDNRCKLVAIEDVGGAILECDRVFAEGEIVCGMPIFFSKDGENIDLADGKNDLYVASGLVTVVRGNKVRVELPNMTMIKEAKLRTDLKHNTGVL